jgi:L-malate glycosyltransferase
MRICYYADGRYVHAERWMKFLAGRGHEMHLISFAEVPDHRIEGLKKIGVKYHGSTGNFHIKKFWLTLADLRFVKGVLRNEKIDVLHSHFLGSNAWYGALSGHHPHIITIMGGGDVTGPNWKPDSNRQAKTLTPYALRNADYITSWSRLMADVVEPYCNGTPIEVVHGGVDLDSFFPGERPAYLLERLKIPTDANVVFSPRLMRPLSNIFEIAQAAEVISGQRPNTFYVVAFPETAVDEEYAARVKLAFEEGAGKNKVRFVSEIAHSEIADYFRLADVMVSIPSTDGTPMTVLESMACGTPTVIGDLPDYDKEYFEHEKTTRMANVKDPQAVAASVLRLLSDKDMAASIAAEARRRVVETGSYEFQMEKMEKIYKRVAR